MSLPEDFAAAQARVKALSQPPSTDELLELYALYKQATAGDVQGSRPGMLDFKAAPNTTPGPHARATTLKRRCRRTSRSSLGWSQIIPAERAPALVARLVKSTAAGSALGFLDCGQRLLQSGDDCAVLWAVRRTLAGEDPI